MTVKDDHMYVGSFGSEWLKENGEVANRDLMWIKVVDQFGMVKSVDWTKNYEALRKAAGLKFPGFWGDLVVQKGKVV